MSRFEVVTLAVMYIVITVAFMAAYLVLRLRVRNTRLAAAVIAAAAAVEVPAFAFLALAGLRGWVRSRQRDCS